MPLTESELESKLWRAADILRGQIDAADYKNYIFSLLFLKRLSDRFEEEIERAIAEGVDRQTAESDPDEHEFFVPAACRWPALASGGLGLGEVLNRASFEIEAANTPRLDGILKATNWNDESKLGSPANREEIIRGLLTHFSDLDLRDAHLLDEGGARRNVLGDAYEYMIKQFADDSGRRGGEFYTPRWVVRLLVELLDPAEGMRICDPTVGSGGMLIYAADYVRERGGDPVNLVLHGQERNLGTLGICKMNMLLHGLRSARIEGGDTIREPRLLDDRGRLLAYDRVIANPTFGLKEWGYEFAETDPHHRFDRFGVPPRTKGEFAFMEHMLATVNASGKVCVVMPHGVLFRGGGEAKIRTNIVRADLFEAVIGLAPNLFYGAAIPVAICVLTRAKPADRVGKVLFVDASQVGYFRAGKAQNYLDPEHIAKIVAMYRSFDDVPGFAHVAELAEIEGNDCNLNVSRYIEILSNDEQVDVGAALARLRELEQERDAAVARMNSLLAELGYAS